ncbi:hypothetical protein BGZ65_003582 [Modicella reniformis]|uniref:Uncharacterized protein n=1 Tax=Modicella reniformis TaxID=1440133 RepID=A0A9P6IZI9_9FUNG|nr:hypothetical protein BGZ65_003582 [Modicella reniformis]
MAHLSSSSRNKSNDNRDYPLPRSSTTENALTEEEGSSLVTYATNTTSPHHTTKGQHTDDHYVPPPPLQQQQPTGWVSVNTIPIHSYNGQEERSFRHLQEHCAGPESDLSELLSEAQQQCSHAQESLETLKQQYEITLIQYSESQTESHQSKVWLTDRDNEIHQLKSQVHDLSRELKEVTEERNSLSFEMVECHTDNAKFLKRLRIANDNVDSLQEENQHLIEQLRELRAVTRSTEVAEEKRKLQETLDRERQLAGQAALDLERVVTKYKGEVEKLQDLVLAIGHKHVQVQSQLAFLQQQAQIRQQQKQEQEQEQFLLLNENVENSGNSSCGDKQAQEENLALSSSSHLPTFNSALPQQSLDSNPSATLTTSEGHHEQEEGLVLSDATLVSILSSVAANSHLQRSKPTRRFTVNALSHHPKVPLTLEQRKHELLMHQITVLQRGYDVLRQEKITLESQLDRA